MLIAQEQGQQPSKESQAFSAVMAMYGISCTEIARISGVQKGDVERFKAGSTHITSRTLARIIGALDAEQRLFYTSMMSLQWTASDANIKLPIFNFPVLDGTADVFREAYRITTETFGIQDLHIAKASGLADSNLNAWKKGSSDCEMRTLNKIKGAFSREQRTFMQTISDILFNVSKKTVQKQMSL